MGRSVAPVSVIIPCYRAGSTIGRAVASVANQTWPPAELIIVDDGSDDGTRDILCQLQRQHGRNWLRLIALPENRGPGAARNAGWEASTQPYVAFLDADDAWHPRKVELQCQVMLDNPLLALTGHRWRWVRSLADGDSDNPDRIRVSMLSKWTLLVSNVLSTPTVMLKRDLPFRFHPSKKYSEDYLLWLQILFSGYRAAFIHAELAYLYKPPYGASGLSGHLWQMQVGELANYYLLWKERRLSAPLFVMACALSTAKFVRRLLNSMLLWNSGRQLQEGVSSDVA